MSVARKRAMLEDSAPLFAALGDATRLRLVIQLCEGGPQSIAKLTAGSDFTRQGITKHLRVLAEAGLVRGLRKGRESRWEIEAERLDVARRYLDLISARWDQRLSALQRHLEETKTAVPRPRSRKSRET